MVATTLRKGKGLGRDTQASGGNFPARPATGVAQCAPTRGYLPYLNVGTHSTITVVLAVPCWWYWQYQAHGTHSIKRTKGDKAFCNREKHHGCGTVISPARDTPMSRRTSAEGKSCPKRNMSFVMADSVVLSCPHTTPASMSWRPVS